MLTGIMKMALEELIGLPIKYHHPVGIGKSLKRVAIMDDMNGSRLIPEYKIMAFPRVLRCHNIDRGLSLTLFTHKVGIMLSRRLPRLLRVKRGSQHYGGKKAEDSQKESALKKIRSC
jgi:hypothetical protein